MSNEPLWRELVGATLRTVRTRRGERLSDVAERAGVSTQYLSEIERGLKDPSSEMLAAVAGALDLSVRELGLLTVQSVVAVASTPFSVTSVTSAPGASGAPHGALCLAA
ncbi:helix-turn-helix domain-containing protein [Nocardioides marmoribigeumensis]|uniref:Transcriptional regulator with XRE-family HTH domain n=1 Tax=Nocardioides marmoribigeumensis TaxID=433649 RepID=A0ABU2BYL0_9ACTN|nr:helix-turn-helix transcriptional regulator [Nocardioides marmoribigeumensis]MDR7363477.1 transcriptional regulator with XRE-family HTH domain [Nocardioides marmoribigeumensis]